MAQFPYEDRFRHYLEYDRVLEKILVMIFVVMSLISLTT